MISPDLIKFYGAKTAALYTPSPVLYKGLLHYTQSNQALLSCTEAKTGITHIDRERLNGLANVYSSLVAADEKVYITARGATGVRARRKFEPLATNKLDDRLDAPALTGNQFLKRTSVSLLHKRKVRWVIA